MKIQFLLPSVSSVTSCTDASYPPTILQKVHGTGCVAAESLQTSSFTVPVTLRPRQTLFIFNLLIDSSGRWAAVSAFLCRYVDSSSPMPA